MNILKKLTWLVPVLLTCILLLFCYLSFKIFNVCPWVIIFLAIFLYLIGLGLKSKNTNFKMLYFNTSAIIFALFIYETYLWRSKISHKNGQSVEMIGSSSEVGYILSDPYLGYKVNKEGVYTSKKIIDNEVIYDVSYTIKDGRRYTPNSNNCSMDCALFFGCSFTFGEGLSDTSTLPFYFNQYAGQRFKVFNYGFHGYGPHQMLAYIENYISKDLKPINGKKLAIFSFLPFDHIARDAGHSKWDRHGSRYEVVGDSLKRTGTYTIWPEKIEDKLLKSFIYNRFFLERKLSHRDLVRTTEIIKKSNTLLMKEGITLYLFMWDDPNECEYVFQNQDESDYFFNQMKRSNIKIFFLHNVISGFDQRINEYTLHKEGHPNEAANKIIAQYLYSQINDTLQTFNKE